MTPLIELPPHGSLAAALQVAPLIPGQSLAPHQLAAPAAYGVQPTTFPFWSAPAFNLMPQAPMMMPPPLPMQTFVAFVTLMPQQMAWPPVHGWQQVQPQPQAWSPPPAGPAAWHPGY